MRKQTDVAQAPESPQLALGATADDAKMYQQLVHSPLEGPGGIVNRLTNQQWQISRAQTDAEMSRDHSTPYG